MSEQVNQSEYAALAPQYLAILDRLSDDPELKFVFYSMDNHFEDRRAEGNFRGLMYSSDPQVREWEQQARERQRAKQDQEEKLEEEEWRALRLDRVQLQDLMRVRMGNDGTIQAEVDEDAAYVIANCSSTTYPDAKSWTKIAPPHGLRTFVYTNKVGESHAVLLYSLGAITTTILPNEEGILVLGDKLHGVNYDAERDALVGHAGSAKWVLNEYGRRQHEEPFH